MAIKWGILGCGQIAQTFVTGLEDSKDGQIHGCAARDPLRANEFARLHTIPNAYPTYDDLLADDAIDAVYVATTHNAHFELVRASLLAGKHVLVEKPITVNAEQAEQLAQLADKSGLFLMEAVWTRFLPAIQALQQEIAQGVIGEVVTLKADFSLALELPNTHRLRNPDLAGGALLDLGIYPLTLASIVFGKMPDSVQSAMIMDSTGVDQRSFYTLRYGETGIAQLSSGYTQAAPIEAIISGNLGYIKVDHFLGAQGYHLCLNDEEPVYKSFPFDAKHNFLFEIDHANACIAKGIKDSSIMPINTSVEMMCLMDGIRRQWGLKYPFEHSYYLST